MCFRWSLFNYFFCYSYFLRFFDKKLNCLQMDTWTWRQGGNPHRRNMRKVHSNNTCYQYQGRSKLKFCYGRDKNLCPLWEFFYVLEFLITIPMRIALVKSYMNKLQTRIKERYPKWSNFLTVFLFLCILFKYFSSFALPKNWRPRQLPLSPRPCYGPACYSFLGGSTKYHVKFLQY